MKMFLSLMVLAAMLLSACAATATPVATAAQSTPTPAPAAAKASLFPTSVKQTEVTWYVRSNAAEQKWEIETIILNFQKKSPGIKISLVVAPTADFDAKLQAMVAAGNPPDVWSQWGTSGFQDYLQRGLVADLTPFIETDHFDLSDFETSALAAYQVNGKLMGLPMQTTGSFIFYNKDLFDKAGVKYPTLNWDDRIWTWDKFLEMCKALTKIKGDPKTDVYGCNLDLKPNNAYAWLWGVDFYPDSAYTTGFADKVTLNDPVLIGAYQARQDIVWKDKSMPVPAISDTISGGRDIFKSGRIGMQLAGGAGWWNFTDIKNFKWGAAALPYNADGRRDVVFTDPWLLSAKTLHPYEAWTFLKYLAEAAQQASWMKLSGTPPARKSLADAWYRQFPGMTPDDVKQVHLGALKYGRESPSHLLARFDVLDKIVGAALYPIENNLKQAADALPVANKPLADALVQIQAEFKK